MSIKIRSFGGPLVWILRKHYSQITTKVSFSFVENMRKDKINTYIAKFVGERCGNIPDFKFLMIETVNRCNGKCAFCPANVHDEKRPFMKMPIEMIDHILDELVEMNWNGTIFPQVNNEPFIDNRMLEILKKCKQKRPESKVFIITNGSLLTTELVDKLVGLVDILTINDYSERYRLSKNLKKVYKHIKENRSRFETMSVTIARRYTQEILSTRAGNAPNKRSKDNKISSPCIYPYTDMIIFPNGNVGICCNDCSEVTQMGNVMEQSLSDIWRGEAFTDLRQKMSNGRMSYHFCEECDVVDAGSRESVI